MSMNDLFTASAKPKLITMLTSGTGTYVPTADMARCLFRIQAGGGGGYTSESGGGGGAMAEVMVRVPIAGIAYAVGAGGAVSGNGSASTVGQFSAMPGRSAASPALAGMGGILGLLGGSVDADKVTTSASSPLPGVAGGGGGRSSVAGKVAGFPYPASVAYATSTFAESTYNGQGNGSGGNSFYGKGGTTGNAPAAGNYGAGGGANAAGLGGCIEVWDFGA